MGRFLSIAGSIFLLGLACLAFYVAGCMALKGPDDPAPAVYVGYYIGVAIVAAFGVFCLVLPALIAYLLRSRPAPTPSMSDATFSGTEQWRKGEAATTAAEATEFVPSPLVGPIGLVVAVAILVVPAYFWRDVYAGPQSMTNADLATRTNLTDLASRWVTLTPEQVIDPEISYLRKRKSAPPERIQFVLLRIDNKLLIAQLDSGQRVFSGFLEPASVKDFADRGINIVEEVRKKQPKLVPHLLPFQLTCQAEKEVPTGLFVTYGLCIPLAMWVGWMSFSAAQQRRKKLNAARLARPVSSAVPQSAALAFAPGFGRNKKASHGLGELLSVHEPAGMRLSTFGWLLAAAALFGVAGFLGFAIVNGHHVALREDKPIPDVAVYALAIVPACVGLFCLVPFLLALRPRPTVRLYTGGLEIEYAKGPAAFSWDEIDQYLAPVGPYAGGTWVFELAGGRVLKFPNDLDRPLEFYNGVISEYGVPALVERALRRIKEGESVRLGDFTVSRQGLTLGRTEVAWKQIHNMTLVAYPRRGQMFLRVNVEGWVFTWQSGNLWKMKSDAVFRCVLERGAAAQLWRKMS